MFDLRAGEEQPADDQQFCVDFAIDEKDNVAFPARRKSEAFTESEEELSPRCKTVNSPQRLWSLKVNTGHNGYQNRCEKSTSYKKMQKAEIWNLL